MEINFGNFLEQKRKQKGMTMRKFAELIPMSAPYLSDIEKNRRNPPPIDKLNRIAEVLCLTDEEKIEMLNLAGSGRDEVAPDLPEYIKSNDFVATALRTAKDLGAGEEEWLEFVEELKKRRG